VRELLRGWTPVLFTVTLGVISVLLGGVTLLCLVGTFLEGPDDLRDAPWLLLWVLTVPEIAICAYAMYLRVDDRPMGRWLVLGLGLTALTFTAVAVALAYDFYFVVPLRNR
jgi:hypothetical protein